MSFMFDCLFTPSRQLLIGIRVILSGKEFNCLERQYRGSRMKMNSHQGSMIKTSRTTIKRVTSREPSGPPLGGLNEKARKAHDRKQET
jgi:hypothetical protein